MGRRATAGAEPDSSVEAGTPPQEAGGENAVSLFDASGDARVRLFRRDDKTQKMTTHGFFPPTVCEEDVAKAFGGGYYRAQLVMADPTSGLTKIKQSRDFQIPGAYRPPSKINGYEDVSENGGSASTPQSAVQSVAGVAGGDDLMSVLRAGIINTLLDMMKSNREIQQRPTTDPLLLEFLKQQSDAQRRAEEAQRESHKQVVDMQLKMMDFIVKQSTNDKGPSRQELLDELTKYKELFGGAAGSNGMENFKTLLETFREFRDAAEDVASPKGSGDPLMDSIPKLVEVVAEQHQMSKQRPQASQAPRQVPVPSTTTPTAEVHKLPDIPVWRQLLRQQGARLLASAAAKHDPEVIAGTAVLFAPDHLKHSLREFFHRDEPEVVADILTEIPQLAEYREWLTEFVNNAQFRLFPEEFDGEDGDETPEPEGDEAGAP